MADDEELNYVEGISLLREMNLPLPDGVENIADPVVFPDMEWPPAALDVDGGCNDPVGVLQNQLGAGNAAASLRREVYAIDDADQPASTNADVSVNSDSQAVTSQVSSETKKRTFFETEKIASYFIADEITEGGKLVKRSTCKGPRCPVVLYTHSTRRRKFHVMNCVDIDYRTRKFYHDKSKAKDKPPLLRYPSPGVTVAGARNIVKNLTGQMLDTALNSLMNPDVWEAGPLFSKFAAKKTEVKESRPSNEVSSVEDDISHHLLIRLIVEENLPFGILSRPGGKDRLLAEYAKFIRPAITLPSAATLSTVLLDSYYEIIKSRVKSEIINGTAGLVL